MKLATYDEARQWLKDKPRRMKANPQSFDLYHMGEHGWYPSCENHGCLPVDATVETHDGVTTDGHGQLLGKQGSEPRRMKANPHTKWGAKHRVEHEENCRCAEYPACLPVDAPEGTPVERWLKHIGFGWIVKEWKIYCHETMETVVELLCALLSAQDNVLRCCRETSGQHLKDAQEQRTRAEKAEEQARLGWERAGEKDAAYGKMIEERDQLKADLAAAWEREAKLREAVSRIADELKNGPWNNRQLKASCDLLDALAATKEDK